TLADRVVVLRDGAIEQVGAPLELYDKPANQFVAQFIGMPSMNIVKAAQLSQFGTLAGQAAGRVPADGLIGVRPEGVRVLPVGSAGVPGKVELIEALGADTLIHVDVMGTPMISRQAERTQLHIGDPVSLEFDLNTLHCFDKAGRMVALG
ncbi:MAG: TOBE domain-containing protein, partial [Burkholderiales bacterium]|nr:TOBE domain-containing protein [Burkholderiales bacterium]